MSKLVAGLRKIHTAIKIRKDFPLKEIVQKENEPVELNIIGVDVHYMAKYDSSVNGEDNGSKGYHTTFVLEDEKRTGSWSNSLYDFAAMLAKLVHADITSDYNSIKFDKPMTISITKIPLEGGKKSTYNVDIVGGEAEEMVNELLPEVNTLTRQLDAPVAVEG